MTLWPWVRGEWRRTWVSLLGVAMLLAIGGGITLGALAGARRADSALDRRIEAEGWTINATIGSLVDLDQMDGVVDRLLPEVAQVPGVNGAAELVWTGVGLEIDGEPGFFFSGTIGDVVGDQRFSESLVAGRAADPSTAHEVTINEEAATQGGFEVGDTVRLRSYASDQIAEFYEGNGAPDNGPRVEARVVGIVRSLEDITTQPEARVNLTAAFIDEYGDQIVHCACSIVAAVPLDRVDAVADEIRGVVRDDSMVVGTITDEQSTILDQAVRVEVGALVAAAVVAAAASLVVMLQALARQSATRGADATSLMAIGATGDERTAAWMTVIAPSLLLGTVGAVLVATLLSPLFPRGIARTAETDPGLRFDAPTLLGGALVLLVVLSLGALWLAWRSARRTGATAAATASGTTRGFGSSPAVSLGANLAADPARHGRRVAALGAVAAAAFAIAGIAGVAVIERSVDDTLTTAEAVGLPWDLELQEAPADPEALIAATTVEPIDALAFDMRIGGTDFEISGDGGDWNVQPITFDNLVGDVAPFITAGSGAGTDSEVVLGEQLARQIGADVGSEVTLNPGGIEFTVSGLGRLSDGDRADEVAFVTPAGLTRLGQGIEPDLNAAVVRLDPDADAGVRERLVELGWNEALLPAKISTLEQIGTVPRLLAVGLTLLGIAALVHTLLVAVTRRRADIAVARALGFVPGQARATIGWQAVLTAAVALCVGIPIGVIVGRVIWKQVVTDVGALDIVVIPWVALVLVAIGALALAALCGLVVGRRAARLRPAAVLRSE